MLFWPRSGQGQQNWEFLGKFNELIDDLNGAHSIQHVKKANPRLAPYKEKTDWRFKEIKMFLQYLRDWKEEVMALPNLKPEERKAMLLSSQTLTGLEMTICSFVCCTRFLLGQGTKFVMARVFQQDPIEHYFSQQRGALGGSRAPDVNSYLRTQGLLHVHGRLKMKRKGANTEHVADEEEDLGKPLKKRRKKATRRSLIPEEPGEEDNHITLPMDISHDSPASQERQVI